MKPRQQFILEECSLECEILKLLAKIHIASHQQMFELFREFSRQDVLNAVETLKQNDYLYIQNYEIPAPFAGKITATTKKVSVKTYALNYKSRQIILKKFKILTGYRRTNPTGLRYKSRIYHDLLCTQALIYLSKTYDIADVFNEEYLQRRGEQMSDLRIQIDNGGGDFEFINCEIVVSNTKKDIENKPNNILFFTYSSYQADIIHSIKNVEPIILSVEGDPFVEKNNNFENETSENSNNKFHICSQLNRAGGALTAPALAKLLVKDPAQTASMLKQMENNGYLFSDRIHRNVENPAGNRTKIYATNRDFIRERADRTYSLMLSDLILRHNNMLLYRINRQKRIAILIDVNQNQTLFYLENNENSVYDEYLNFKSIANNGCKNLFSASFESRLNELKTALKHAQA